MLGWLYLVTLLVVWGGVLWLDLGAGALFGVLVIAFVLAARRWAVRPMPGAVGDRLARGERPR
jgi:hypothetical protein